MSETLKSYLKTEAENLGFKQTEMNDKLFEIIARAVDKYIISNSFASVESGDSAGIWSLITK